MLHKTTCLLVSAAGLAAVLSQPSTAWAQAGPNLVIAMSHTGNFTLGQHGVYTIVVSNIGGTASSGQIEVGVFFPNYPNTTNFGGTAMGNGWSCDVNGGIPTAWIQITCVSTSVIAAGGSAFPLLFTVIPTGVGGTVTNTAFVVYPCIGGIGGFCSNSASDPTIVLPAVPTLPEWAMVVLIGLLVSAGVGVLRKRTT